MDDTLSHYWECRKKLERIYDAYIVESKRPDGLPEMRFRVTKPDGTMSYHPARIEAFRALMDAINPPTRGASEG